MQLSQTQRLDKDSWTAPMMGTQDWGMVADLWVDNQGTVHCYLEDMRERLMLGKVGTVTFQGCLCGQEIQDSVDN